MNGKIGKEEIGSMKMRRIDHVVLPVADLNVTRRFGYVRIIGVNSK